MAQEKRFSGLKKVSVFFSVCAALLLGAMSQTSYALQLNSTPDIKVGVIEVRYVNGGSGNNFSALGYAESFNGDTSLFGSNSYFDLYAIISSAGVLGGGTLSIYEFGTTTTYLTGNLTNVDFTTNNPVLNFLFTPTGGSYQTDYGSLGGIILGNSGFNLASSGFDSNFGTLSANADVGTPVPEPSSVCLLLLGAVGLFFVRRRKS